MIVPLSSLFTAHRHSGQWMAWRGTDILTWGQFCADVAGMVARLKATSTCRAGLVCQDSYWFAVGLFSLLASEITVVLPAASHPKALSAMGDQFDLMVGDQLIPGMPMMQLEPGQGAWAEEVDPNAAIEFFTSGSTGSPKRIVRTLHQLDGEVAAIDRHFGPQIQGAPVIATVPHHHAYGIIFKILWPLAATRMFSAHTCDVWEEVRAELRPGSMLVSSPAHLSRLGGIPCPPKPLNPQLILSAGAPLPLTAAQDAHRVFGSLPTEIYGSTETGAIATRIQTAEDAPWIPLPGNEVIRTDDGLLALRSPYVLTDQFLTIADRVELDGNVGFHLRGRADHIAKIEGKRISLPHVEHCLKTLPQIADAAVLVVRDVLAAVVVLAPQARTELQQMGPFRYSRMLRCLLAEEIEPAGLPRRWRFVEAMPTGSMGKRSMEILSSLFLTDGDDET